MKKNKYEVVPATLEHAKALMVDMREPDIQEIWAAAHLTPEQAVCISLAGSRDAGTGLVNGKVLCMFGIGSATVLSTTGVPWLLATNDLEKHSRAFLYRNKKGLAKMMNGYDLLRNYVDVRHTAAIRWLRWLGFDILPPEPWGVEGMLFHPFEMRA